MTSRSNRKRMLIENLEQLLENHESLSAASVFLQSEDVEWTEADETFVANLESWMDTVESVLSSLGKNDDVENWRKARTVPVTILNVYDYAERMKTLLQVIKSRIEQESNEVISQELFAMDIVNGTRGYIEQIALQANGCYEKGWYDACAVMIRRLIETLIIECFEHHGIAVKIKDDNGNYLYLNDLITRFLGETTWNVGRNTKNSLPKLKGIGDLSAHSRRFVARQHDIDKLADDIRVAIQELTYIAGFDIEAAGSPT